MLAPNPATSSVLVGVSSSFNFQCMGALQLAPDGKIYISINSESWLSAINSPNSLGVSCGFVDQAVTLQQVGLFPSPGLLGLPQYVPFVNGSITPSLTSVSVCQNQLPFLWNGNSYNAPGNYSVVLTNIAGCDSIANLNLSVVGSPSSTTNLTICSDQLPFVWNGQSLNSPGTYTAILNNITGCDSLATLNLFVSNTSVSTTNLNLCADQLPIIWNSQSIADSGTYTAVLLNGAGCDSIATLVLSVNAVDTVSSSISLCRSRLPYLWNGISIFNTGEYVYSMTASTGCDSVLTLNVVIDPDTLVYEIITSGSCIGDGTEFDLNSSSDILSILWNFGDPQTTSDTNSLLQPSYFYTNVGSYPVTAFISTACKSDTLRTEVEIVDCDTFDFGCNIFLPNAFTPNNDQLNERYFPVFDCPVDNFLFTIFNRWGQVVFSTTDTLSLGWDGIYDDLDCPMGVYVAKLKVKFVNGQEADLLRVLTLLR
jgi:gliding motility-associated-like protein